MTPACAVFIATSLDGFVARPAGRIDWLEQANAAVPPGENCGYAEFMSTVDALVMGLATFTQVCQFPSWPYGATPEYGLSRPPMVLPDGTPSTVRLLTQEPLQVVLPRDSSRT
jgi:hypothetical protein